MPKDRCQTKHDHRFVVAAVAAAVVVAAACMQSLDHTVVGDTGVLVVAFGNLECTIRLGMSGR